MSSESTKVLKKLVNDQLRTFLFQCSILKLCQSGFRAGCSTVMAALEVLNDVISALDNKQDCVAHFTD